MRTIIVTQEEHMYLPSMLGKVLSEWQEDGLAGMVILEGETSTKNVRKYLEVLTFREIVRFSGLLIRGKLMATLARIMRYRLSNGYSVESVAAKHGIPVYRTSNINSTEFIEHLKSLEIELIVSIAAPQVFGKRLLHLPEFGCINVHCALLPEYRGMLPTFWVLASGEKQTGVTVHYMNENLDDGDIILQERVNIHQEDTFHSLVTRLKSDLAPRLLLTALQNIRSGKVEAKENDRRFASYFSFPKKRDIDRFRQYGRRFC